MASILLTIMLISVIAFAVRCAIYTPYKFRMTLAYTGLCLFIALVLPFMFLRPRDYRNGLWPAWVFKQLCYLVGISVEVQGIENVQQRKGGVLLINHQSIVDVIIPSTLWPLIGRATVVGRREILLVPFLGIGSWLWGTLYINRSNAKNAIADLKKQMRAITEDNAKILIFPEGKRGTGEGFLPFKKGPFHLAMSAQCPIQPVVIRRYKFTDAKCNSFKPGHIIIKILPEIQSTDFDNIDELSNHCRNVMLDEYARLNATLTD